MLKAENISVTLGRKTILDGLGFAARAGGLTCIVGPNGSGKTTLLRAMTGDVPYRGTVTLDGDDIARLKPWDLAARRGVLPQASVLAFPFTVAEVVQIGLHHGVSGHRDDITLQALAKVDLAHYADRPYQELSGGEQQRVQLARVLAQIWHPVLHGQPRWLFLDEPVSALDIAHQLQVMRLAAEFAQAGGGAVAVMHDLNLTAMFARQVFLMKQGACVAHGTPAEVLTDKNLSHAYGCDIAVGRTPPPGIPFLLPHVAALAADQITRTKG